MQVTFANNLSIIADQAGDTTITTDPIPVPGNLRKLQLTLNVHRFLGMLGASAAQLDITAEGSNDGQTWFTSAVPQMTATLAVPNNDDEVGDFDYAFCRVKFIFGVTGSAGDWAYFIGDVHGCFKST